MSDAGRLVELPLGPRRTVRVLAEFAADLEDRVLRALARLHAARPRQSAIPRSHVAATLPDIDNDTLVAGLLDRLKAQGKVVCDSRTVALQGHEPKLSQAERRLKNELAEAIRSKGFCPPDASELAALGGPRKGIVAELLALLRDEQRLVEVGPGLFLDFDAEAEPAPARGRAAGRRLADHHGRAARPARHHQEVRGADRRTPRQDRPDPARGGHPSPGRPGRNPGRLLSRAGIHVRTFPWTRDVLLERPLTRPRHPLPGRARPARTES